MWERCSVITIQATEKYFYTQERYVGMQVLENQIFVFVVVKGVQQAQVVL